MPHTHSHVSLASIRSRQDIERELLRPKAILEDLIQETVDAFAFPFGTENAVSREAFSAMSRIYRACFSGLHGANTHRTQPHYLYRDCLHPFYPLTFVDDIVKGNLDGVYALKMRRLRRRTGAALTAGR
jgi:peptidoglycan/xylan/chitin deacetylase (PgdA/CDA1 family)